MCKFIPNVKISAVHGGTFKVDWNGNIISVVPMYHPAAALRRTEVKNQLENDFRALPGIIDKVMKEKVVEKKENIYRLIRNNCSY
jgi:uracil-DNA glycosylase family 4